MSSTPSWRAKSGAFVAILGVLGLCAGLRAEAFKKGPYLIYEGDPTKMRVLWQLEKTETCVISWGTDTTYSMGAADTTESNSGISGHQHSYTIVGLTPGMKYYYRVETPSYGIATGAFSAAPAANAVDARFLAYGDTRSYPLSHESVAGGMMRRYAGSTYPSLCLHVGDWVNAGDSEGDWTSQFFPASFPNIRQFQANIPISGCIGNHEQTGTLYEKYFPYPYVTTDTENAFYWSFDYGPIHIVVVDQYRGYTRGSDQYAWCLADLRASDKEWKVIIFHVPAWSATGGHGSDEDGKARLFIEGLSADGVNIDMVFAGHNHYYARCFVAGIQHITTGGGGAPLRSVGGRPSGADASVAEAPPHFCDVTVHENTLAFKAIRVYAPPDGDSVPSTTTPATDGAILDSFTIRKIYVDGMTGNDLVGVGTRTSPFKTIQKALQAANAGDRIIIMAGDYPENVRIDKQVRIEVRGGRARIGR